MSYTGPDFGLGDIHVARGDLPGALSLYREASSDAERLAKADPFFFFPPPPPIFVCDCGSVQFRERQ